MQIAAAALVLGLVAAACGGGDEEGPGVTAGKRGGILRTQTDGFLWDHDLDPTGEYTGAAHGLFTNLLTRTLLSYKHARAAEGGNELRPDLASDLGQVSADQKTYTFTIKKGVRFSPPVNREVTTKDIKYALKRVADLTFSGGGYSTYYVPNIVGMQEYQCSLASAPEDACRGVTPANDIAGIETPDDQTIIFKLKEPVGDFRFRLSMPAASPIPEEVAKCATKLGEYGRFLIATGPYMFEGVDKLDASDCASLKKGASGFDPTAHVRIRRNPNYDPATDTKEMRENFIDGLDITLNTNSDDIFKRVEANLIDMDYEVREPPTVLQRLGATDKIHVEKGDRTWYIFFNLLKRPFDDVHVRKAASFVMDKAALVRARGGRFAGLVGEHIVPPEVLGALPPGEFDPYGSEGDTGDLEKAKAEMRQSRYDTDKDGICDASACRNVLHMTRNTPPYTDMVPVIEQSLAKIGIRLVTRPQADFYSAVQVPTKTPPIGSGTGWGKDYADASTFFVPLLSSGAISKEGTANYSFLGLTRELAREIGVDYPAGGVPSIDADIERCQPRLIGDPRTQCWTDLDKRLMDEIVPWIPYNWATSVWTTGDAVVKFAWDSFPGTPAWSHISLDTTKQVTG